MLWDSREDLDTYEQSSLHHDLVDRARAFYVGDFWVKYFDRPARFLRRIT